MQATQRKQSVTCNSEKASDRASDRQVARSKVDVVCELIDRWSSIQDQPNRATNVKTSSVHRRDSHRIRTANTRRSPAHLTGSSANLAYVDTYSVRETRQNARNDAEHHDTAKKPPKKKAFCVCFQLVHIGCTERAGPIIGAAWASERQGCARDPDKLRFGGGIHT
nr:uncharacterized protein LOC115264074 [Aedes albopictus]